MNSMSKSMSAARHQHRYENLDGCIGPPSTFLSIISGLKQKVGAVHTHGAEIPRMLYSTRRILFPVNRSV